MSGLRRRIAPACLLAVGMATVAAPAVAHPLGNATVSRGVAVTLRPTAVAIDYVVDMAEIPAFAAIQALDTDADGAISTTEAAAYAQAACAEALGGLALDIDGHAVVVEPTDEPSVSFPPGVGGLETLRLECSAGAPLASPVGGDRRTLHVADRGDDGRPGWREITVSAASGVVVLESDAPQHSPSAGLTSYPEDLLAAPIDIRAATAVFSATDRTTAPPNSTATAGSRPPDPLAALLTAPAAGGGGVGLLLGLLLSMALGAAHALSPGHGKALVAAALVASRGSARNAIGLGLAVAASHTMGVLGLGGILLVGGAAFAPDRLLAWMSLAAGACVVLVGAALLLRAAFGPRPHRNEHDHLHPHPHAHPHPGLATRSVVGLGLFGGLVPSSSAVIVLLLAVTTGQVAFGLGLIVAFGLGMAAILGGFALVSSWLGGWVVEARVVMRWPVLARIGTALPMASAVAVVVAGTLMTVGALSQVI